MILIRADANEQIGAGHVMRCLSIAQALRARGAEVRFVTADHRADRLIGGNGFAALCLETDWRDKEAELPALLDAVKRLRPSLLLADGYTVTPRYLAALRAAVPVAYLDDLCRDGWGADLLINYNIYAEEADYPLSRASGARLLLSPRYAPLREEFQNQPPHPAAETPRAVFVSAGGADPERVTEKMLAELCPAFPEQTFHFVVGGLNPRLDAIRAAAGDNAVLHVNETEMAALMRRCDAAVAAAGSTLYELCACGVPTVVYTLADNQLAAADRFASAGLMRSAGDCRNAPGFIAALEQQLRELLRNRDERAKKSAAMQTTADGRGADRIAAALTERFAR